MKALIIFSLLLGSVCSVTYADVQQVLSQVYSAEYARTKINPQEEADFKELVANVFKAAAGEINDGDPETTYSGYLPADLELEYYDIAKSLVSRGYARPAQLDAFAQEYNNLKSAVLPSGTDAKEYYRNAYNKLAEDYLNIVKSQPEQCFKGGVPVAYQKCCQGYVKSASFEKQKSCKTSTVSCQSNSECCSGFCDKSNPNLPGRCETTSTCLELKKVGQACDETRTLCIESSCMDVNGQSQCLSCVGLGKEPTAKDGCCPGLYKGFNGKCLRATPPLVPRATSMIEKVLNKFVNIIIPSAYANENDPGFDQSNALGVDDTTDVRIDSVNAEENKLTQAQEDLLKEKEKTCGVNFGEGSTKYKECKAEVERQRYAYQQDVRASLQASQIKELEDKRQTCFQNNPNEGGTQGNTALEKCLAKVDELEKQMIGENAAEGVLGEGTTAAEYMDTYEIPAITAKTYSDIKSCEFNSYNDNWRDASNQERNAEVFMRAFEFAYSGEGSNDYWQDGTKGNIFKRAKKIATAFQKNRYEMIKKLQEIDKEMGCKCIAIFGPERFSAEKQAFFNQNCEVEKAELQAQLGENEESNIDGSSIDSGLDRTEKAEAQAEEIDKGATGISYEKLIVTWLGLRGEATALRFTKNAELEEEAQELSEFIAGVDFTEAWKDRVSGKKLLQSDPPGDSVLLYKWGFKYYKGWVVTLVKIATVFIVDLNEGKSGSIAKSLAKLLDGVSEATRDGFKAAYREKEPMISDAVIYKKKSAGTFKKKDAYSRYYIGPRFDNKSPVAETRCQVYAGASACLKSMYKTEFDGKTYYLIDPLRPMFVTDATVKTEVVETTGQNWVEMVNEARDKGVDYLKSTLPGGSPNYIKNVSKSFGSKPVMKWAIEKNHFAVKLGQFVDPLFSEDKVKIIKKAAEKYAMCKRLQNCGAPDADPQALGFGFLFESESEAKDFAEYTYQMHFKWPKLSEEGMVGYPLIGQSTYFESLAYNLKVIGASAANRIANLGEGVELYTASLNKRISDYDSLGEARMGEKSRNVAFSRAFIDAFTSLNFTGRSNIESFDQKANQAKESNQLSAAELETLGAARQSAIRRNNDVDRAKEFDKLKSQGAIKGSNDNVSKALSSLNSPLNLIKSNKLGGGSLGSGGSGRNAFANNGAKVDDSDSKVNGPKGKGLSGLFAGDASFAGASFGGGSSFGSKGGSSVSAGGSYSQDISPSDADRIIGAINNDRTETDVNELDTLFQRVSKAYKRNLSRVLERASDSKAKKSNKAKRKNLESGKKAQLRNLLENS